MPEAQARRSGVDDRGQGQIEDLRRPELKIAAARAAHAGSQDPERPSMTVVGADFFEPAAIKSKEIAKSRSAPVESEVQERGINRRQPVELCAALTELVELNGEQEARTLSSVQ